MIISHEHRYVFLQLPHTASTAIGDELCEHYGGVPILRKHSNYLEFLCIASPSEKTYFKFSCIRHPLDEAVTRYFRFKTNHRRSFTNPGWLLENGGWVTKRDLRLYHWMQAENVGFADFARAYFRVPYDNWSCLSHNELDLVIRFEATGEGFAEAIARLGLTLRRPLPVVNRTPEKGGDFIAMYPPSLRPWAIRMFGPFMEEWGYAFPADWHAASPTRMARLEYRALKAVRRAYWGHVAVSARQALRSGGFWAKQVLRSVYPSARRSG